ncbi:MAG: hypothetical protein F9K44_01605 [Hyphomicrobiaceae bacterium]|nr:MAG: hypothetical protein F9K44_01605 [Hyphomicrobiaceae bacterium]
MTVFARAIELNLSATMLAIETNLPRRKEVKCGLLDLLSSLVAGRKRASSNAVLHEDLERLSERTRADLGITADDLGKLLAGGSIGR